MYKKKQIIKKINFHHIEIKSICLSNSYYVYKVNKIVKIKATFIQGGVAIQ